MRMNSASKKILRVATAGWSIPARYKELFTGDGTHLEKYAERLHAVEINSSFYRHHKLNTYRRWAESVPAHFRFAVKMSKTLTHNGELAPLPEVLDQFAWEVSGLGEKLGALLVQLPPSLAFNASIAKRFFHEVHQRIDVPIACEPRHPSWGSERVDALLSECAVARVAADPPPWPGANETGGDKRLAYFRWHGHPRKYYSDYDKENLALLWKQLEIARKTADQVWCVFDNTALGYALGNALATIDVEGIIQAGEL